MHDPLYASYKRARNRLRRYEPGSVVTHLVGALYKAHLGGIEIIRHYQPWNILVVLKWTFQEMDGTAHRRPAATLNDVHIVLNIVHDMDNTLPSSFKHLSLFLRRLAFQQFWLHRPDGAALVRQEILFGQLQENHQFSRQFVNDTGVSISTFLDLSFAVLSLLLSEAPSRSFERSFFSIIEPRLPPNTIDCFLRHLARTPSELNTSFNESTIRDISVSDQFILPNPFLRVPLLHVESRYVVYYPPLVYRSFEQSIYRTLRSIDAANFMQKFGPLFERYTEQCLVDAGVAFIAERDLKIRLPGTGKCVDFLIAEDGCNIFIDTKGVEASPLGRVALTEEILYHSIKESAMKAIYQGMETVRRIESAPSDSSWNRTEHFLLVVTFEQLYLGPGSDLADTFGTTLTAGLNRKFGSPLPFPLKNVYFAGIGEFEDLLERIRAKSTTLLSALRYARARDAEPKTRKFNFGQHVDELGDPGDKLPTISAGLRRLQDRCTKYFSPQTGKSRG